MWKIQWMMYLWNWSNAMIHCSLFDHIVKTQIPNYESRYWCLSSKAHGPIYISKWYLLILCKVEPVHFFHWMLSKFFIIMKILSIAVPSKCLTGCCWLSSRTLCIKFFGFWKCDEHNSNWLLGFLRTIFSQCSMLSSIWCNSSDYYWTVQ
jgi:hypothetical protein